MTFKEWLLGPKENPSMNNQWGALHISTLLICIALIIAFAFIFRNKDEKVRRRVIIVLASIILFFEITRRLINSYTNIEMTFNSFLYHLLPRPWCAISCWCIIIAVFSKKQFMYNAACYTSLLCAIIFFAYPSAGYNNQYITFANTYSICTHMLLLITSITFITLKFTKFNYKEMWKDLIVVGIIFVYSVLEIWVLNISSDPLYYMPDNDVQNIVGLGYGLYVVLYFVFIAVYINMFYLISDFNTAKEYIQNCKILNIFRKDSKNLKTTEIDNVQQNSTNSTNIKKVKNKKE